MSRLALVCALSVFSTIGASSADANGIRGRLFGGCRRTENYCPTQCNPCRPSISCQTCSPIVGSDGPDGPSSLRVQDIQNRVIGIQGQIGIGNVPVQQKLDQIRAALDSLEQSIKNNSPKKTDQ